MQTGLWSVSSCTCCHAFGDKPLGGGTFGMGCQLPDTSGLCVYACFAVPLATASESFP